MRGRFTSEDYELAAVGFEREGNHEHAATARKKAQKIRDLKMLEDAPSLNRAWFNYKRAVRVFSLLGFLILTYPPSIIGERKGFSSDYVQDIWGGNHTTPFQGHCFIFWGSEVPFPVWGYDHRTEQSTISIKKQSRQILYGETAFELSIAVAFSLMLGAFSFQKTRY